MAKTKQSHKFHSLLHSAELVQDHLRSQLAPLDVSPQQARVVMTLNRMGEMSQIDVAREFGIAAASMSTMTARLIALDLIRSRKDPANAKRNIVSLTKQGKSLVGDIDRVWAGVDEYLAEMLGARDVSKLAALTLSLRDALGWRRPGG